jgi:hypothetical protein
MTRLVYQYAVLRAVPRVARDEYLNVGIVLYCQDADFLAAAVHLDVARLKSLDPAADAVGIAAALEALRRTCEGAGPAGQSPLGQRFRWLTAPRSTVLQTGPAHSGFTTDPAVELARLVVQLVH